MHWLTFVLTVTIFVLIIAAVAILAYMVTNKPTETDIIGGDPEFGRIGNRISEFHNTYPTMDGYEESLIDMNSDGLVSELRRLMQYPVQITPMESEEVENTGFGMDLLNRVRQMTASTETTTGTDGGDGIVICANGFEGVTETFVLVSMLREKGCTLPVEIWHRTDKMSDSAIAEFDSMDDVQVRNIDAISATEFRHDYASKPLAMYHSKFSRILLLEPRSMVTKDPTYMFDSLTEETPAVFWMDYATLNMDAPCFKVLSPEQLAKVTYTNEQDGSQLLMDKKLCGNALYLCCKINVIMQTQIHTIFPSSENSNDKNTWHFSFLCTDTPFLMVPHRAGGVGNKDGSGSYIGNTMMQFDMEKTPIFLYKLGTSWATLGDTYPQWVDTMKFNNKKGRVRGWNKQFVDATITKGIFNNEFPGLEESCWNKIRDLRSKPWYKAEFKGKIPV